MAMQKVLMKPLNLLLIGGGVLALALAMGWVDADDFGGIFGGDGGMGFTATITTTGGERIEVAPNEPIILGLSPLGLTWEGNDITSLNYDLWVTPSHGTDTGSATITMVSVQDDWVRPTTGLTPRVEWHTFSEFLAPLDEKTQTTYGPSIYAYAFSNLDLPAGDYAVDVEMTVSGSFAGSSVTERLGGTIYLEWDGASTLTLTVGWNKVPSFEMK